MAPNPCDDYTDNSDNDDKDLIGISTPWEVQSVPVCIVVIYLKKSKWDSKHSSISKTTKQKKNFKSDRDHIQIDLVFPLKLGILIQ